MQNDASDQIKAPWTMEQVAALNRFQKSRRFHPFTCARRDDHPRGYGEDHGLLVATRDGWICPYCDYRQDWAHEFMLNKPPPLPFDAGERAASKEALGDD